MSYLASAEKSISFKDLSASFLGWGALETIGTNINFPLQEAQHMNDNH